MAPTPDLVNSTFAPSWSVSGEEMLRAWHSATGTRYNGLVAVDVVALAKVLDATGPATVPGVGELTGSNLAKTLIGSYDDYYPDPTAQDQTFAAVVAALQQKLFSDGEYVAKGRALKSAADGRHFALYMRDPESQAGFAAVGLDGDLTTATGDYVGVFTQSMAPGKVDYYQRRNLDLDVTLASDGTATNRLDALVHNDTPPYAVPGVDAPPNSIPGLDPIYTYFTRWDSIRVSAFLPGATKVTRVSLGGTRQPTLAKTFYDHSYVADSTLIEPGGSTHLRASYSVPGAAEVGEGGTLTYHLAFDPQGTVNPTSADVDGAPAGGLSGHRPSRGLVRSGQHGHVRDRGARVERGLGADARTQHVGDTVGWDDP